MSTGPENQMDQLRFEALIAAYGADVRRWPASERARAEHFQSREPELSARLMFDARMTDALLDTLSPPVVSASLRDAVIAAAPRPRRHLLGALRPRPMAWLSGAGWAAACVAGVMVGVHHAHQLTLDAQADALLYQAEYEAVDDVEILG